MLLWEQEEPLTHSKFEVTSAKSLLIIDPCLIIWITRGLLLIDHPRGNSMLTVLCGMLMTACDVAAIAKPWEQQHELARQVADEFFDQGDMEKLRLNEQPIVSL